MRAFGFSDFHYVLSPARLDDRTDTDAAAEDAIRKALERYELAYDVDEGGGAFYGPKLDINVRDALGRPWQLAPSKLTSCCPVALT